MANSPGGAADRRYNDAEVRLLLERAASLQGSSAPVRSQGFTLAQLEEIAAEAGIDAGRLQQAARELDTGTIRPAGALERMAGGPFRIQVERTLPFEFDAGELGRLLASMTRSAECVRCMRTAAARSGMPADHTARTARPGHCPALRILTSDTRGPRPGIRDIPTEPRDPLGEVAAMS